jgi:hypothetical protein
MAICPAGHDSADPRHCDHCGQLIGTPPGAAARVLPEPVPEWQCPVCGRNQTRRFCEFDGHDSQRVTPLVDSPPVAAEPPPVEPVAPLQWHVVATADRAYFDFVQSTGGAEVGSLTFPTYYPIRRFSLRGASMLIGRYSVHRGIDPEIDLGGTHEDPAVGRAHAQLVSRPNGCWAVVDLESTNHTYLNDFTADPIRPNVVVDLRDGDRIYLGTWTRLTVHARPLSPDGDR